MRNKLYLVFVSIFFSVFLLFNPGTLKADEEGGIFFDPEVKISMDFQDASLKDILKVFSIQSGMNFIASEAVQDRTVTLYLDQVPIKQAMDNLFEANNLSYELDKKANIIRVNDWGVPQVVTITKVYRLKNAWVTGSLLKQEKDSISEEGGGEGGAGVAGGGGGGGGGSEDGGSITDVVKKLITENGSVVEDIRTNSLIVTDVPSRFPAIEEAIVSLDIITPQIMMEVEMIDVSKSLTEKMGVSFGARPLTAVLTGTSIASGYPFGDWAKVIYSGENTRGTIGLNDEIGYTMFFEFLKTQTDSKFLARPRLLTLNNETAEIKISTNESIGVITTTDSESGTITTSPERVETGVSLRITPQINIETGEITMFLYPRVVEATASAGFTTPSGGYNFRDPEERSTKSIVRIKDGETVIIGGLVRNKKSEVITKLPFFGDIPILGKMFFTHRNTDPDLERELLVFITPHIIKESANIELAQVKEVVFPEREQSISSGIGRQETVSDTLNDFEN